MGADGGEDIVREGGEVGFGRFWPPHFEDQTR